MLESSLHDPYTVVTRNMAFPRSMLPSREAPSRRRREDSSDQLDLAEKSLAMAQDQPELGFSNVKSLRGTNREWYKIDY